MEGLVNSDLSEVKCYPNPFGDEITVEINLARDADVEVQVLNQMGQRINTLTTERLFNSGTHKFTWNGRNNSNNQVSSGIYYVRVMLGNEIYFKKVIYSNFE